MAKKFIYCLRNKKTDRAYIGETTNPKARLYHHFWVLRKQESHHPLLQIEFNEFNKDDYTFEILDHTEDERAEERFINEIPPNLSLNVRKRKGDASRANSRLKNLRKDFYSEVE
jgi:hypothetical protein